MAPDELILPDWPAPAGVRAFFTTRAGGASEGPFASLNLGAHVGDDSARVRENRRRMQSLLPAEPLWLNQVHGTEVAVIADDAPPAASSAAWPRADAAVTRRWERPCMVMVADCLPVLLCDRAGTVVGAAHAGWRGLAAGVIERTVAAMGVEGEVIAWLGPAIGPQAFEVGQDVVDAFIANDAESSVAFAARPGLPGKYLADIFTLARRRLASAGVREVYGGRYCTVSDPARFFSYRRDRQTGRMAALIWLERGAG